MHKHNNNNSNKGELDSVTLCRGNRRGGEEEVLGVVGEYERNVATITKMH